MWQPALANFLSKYTPVKTIAESDDQFTTREIKRLLEDHTGANVDLNELYVALLEAGFEYVSQGHEILWLLKFSIC